MDAAAAGAVTKDIALIDVLVVAVEERTTNNDMFRVAVKRLLFLISALPA